ncbi:MAG: A24 family peptidase [Campylobacterales bacterium]
MEWLFTALIGLCLGSFANVLIVRLPQDKSVVFPASACPACGHMLRWYHNIPLLSYLFLRGRCGFCGEKISPLYPIVEAVSGLLFVLAVWKLGFALNALAAGAAFVFLLALAIIDLKHMAVPDSLNFAALFFALLAGPFGLDNLFNALVVAGGLSLLRMGLSTLLKKEAMGEADVILGATMGALLGLHGALLALFCGAVLAILPAALRRKNGNEETPFIPFLAAGTLIVFLFGPTLYRLLGW